MQPRRLQSFSEKDNQGTHLVLFCTSWSAPCLQQLKILDILCNDFCSETEIIRIDIDHFPEIADRWDILSIPTILLINGDREIDRFIGLLSADRLKTILDNRVHPANQVVPLQ